MKKSGLCLFVLFVFVWSAHSSRIRTTNEGDEKEITFYRKQMETKEIDELVRREVEARSLVNENVCPLGITGPSGSFYSSPQLLLESDNAGMLCDAYVLCVV
jgi:hypothetical protein